MTCKYIYAGPSWAARSFDTLNGSESNFTNLAMQWGIPYYDISLCGRSNIVSLHHIRKALQEQTISTPVIFILAEPLMDIDIIKVLVPIDACIELLQCADIHVFRNNLLHNFLIKLNQLDIPVGLIGGHTDVTDEQVATFKNLTVIDSSWQQFLSDRSIQQPILGWGAEVAHRIITHKRLSNIRASSNTLQPTLDQLALWDQLESYPTPLFTAYHPNCKGTVQYAAYLKSKVQYFINTNTKELK